MISGTMGSPLDRTDAASPGADALRDTILGLQADRGAELWGLARHLGLSVEEADDALQETLLRLWSQLRDGRSIDRPDAWAFRTIYRIAMDRHRWTRRVRLLASRVGAEPVRPAAIDPTDRLAIWEAVETLPERQRLAVYLRYRADLPFDAIGQILGIAAPSARSHVSRALDALRSRLGEESFR
jgi:RNA polymerase sigma factor (sigma-70 family)